MSDEIASKYPEVHLPQILTLRNSGFSGTALHSVQREFSYKPKIEKRKFIPVNHFITNNLNNFSVNANHLEGFTDFAPDMSTAPALGHSPSMGIFGEKKPT